MRNPTASEIGKAVIRQMQRHRGITLIELMVVVVIIGILAGIAYPSYTRYVTEARRADGQSGLLQMAGRLEKFFSHCGTYDVDIATAANSFNLCTGLELLNDNSPDRNYVMTIASRPLPATIANSYVITAAPSGAQANDTDCVNLTLNSQGVKGQSGPNAQGRCWKR